MSLQVVIVGGGITGLAAAYALQRQAQERGLNMEYTVLEAADRFGGKVTTDYQDGCVIEGGPDSFLTQKPAALQLCRALGLEDELIPIQEHRPSSYILRGGRLHPLPEGMNLLAPTRLDALWRTSLFTWPAKLRILWERFVPARLGEQDESLASFVGRRLGREALFFLAEPLFAGVHVAEAERLSMAAAFPRFPALERQHGSLTRAARALGPAAGQTPAANPTPAFLTLRDGLGRLIEALASRLQGDDLRLNEPAEAIAPLDSERFTVRLRSGASLTADAVIVTTAAPSAAGLLQDWWPDLAHHLRQVRMNSSATVSLAYEAGAIQHPLNGTGFLVPRTESARITGCTWTSAKFAHRAPDGMVLLRAFVGGPRAAEHVDLDDDALTDMVRREFQRIMSITEAPAFSRVYRWREAHPQYDVGHLELVEAIEHRCPPNLRLAGASYRGLGLPDCIAQGEAAASAILEELARLPVVVKGGRS